MGDRSGKGIHVSVISGKRLRENGVEFLAGNLLASLLYVFYVFYVSPNFFHVVWCMKVFACFRSIAGIVLFSAALAAPFTALSEARAEAIAPSPVAQSPSALAETALPENDAFAPLRHHLENQDWQAADQETRQLLNRWIHPTGDIFGAPLAQDIPADVLQAVDQLWLEASDGRFGFSVQQRIWQEVSAQHPNNQEEAVRAFGRRVGWVRPTIENDNFVSPEWLTEPELENSLEAPTGHFPWAGVSWERIQNLLDDQSCGSCMVDAMYLQGDRFYRYLPVLFTHVQIALANPTLPAPQNWRSPRPRFSIDLNSLYPSNRCPVRALDQAISPNSQILAVSSYSYERACGGDASNSTLALWNAQRGNRIITLMRGMATEAWSQGEQAQEPPTELDRIVGDVANAIAFTPDSQLIAAGLSNGTVRLWRTDNGTLVRTLTGHRYAVRAIAISNDGTRLVSASSDQTIRLWNLQTGELIRTIQLNESDGVVHTALISPDGTRLAIATNRNLLQLRDLTNGRIVRTFVDSSVTEPDWLPIRFSSDGRFVATSDIDHSVKLWNASTGARIITFNGHQAPVTALAFSPDSQTLASASTDYSVQLWDLPTYQHARSLDADATTQPMQGRPPNPGHLDFTADGRVLASSGLLPMQHPITGEPLSSSGLLLWDTRTGETLTPVDAVTDFRFSPDSQFLLTNGFVLQVWQPGR